MSTRANGFGVGQTDRHSQRQKPSIFLFNSGIVHAESLEHVETARNIAIVTIWRPMKLYETKGISPSKNISLLEKFSSNKC